MYKMKHGNSSAARGKVRMNGKHECVCLCASLSVNFQEIKQILSIKICYLAHGGANFTSASESGEGEREKNLNWNGPKCGRKRVMENNSVYMLFICYKRSER
jgi:hypothetical protein